MSAANPMSTSFMDNRASALAIRMSAQVEMSSARPKQTP
jgi:hypothetical protein